MKDEAECKQLVSLEDFSKEELINFVSDLAKRWLAHDGLWFQAVEKKFDIDTAIELDANAWEKFTVIEANRIMSVLGLTAGGGLKALALALNFRLYAYVNEQEIIWSNPNKFIFRMNNCRVQAARNRKSLPDFPCKSVGLVEYSNFAKTIDPSITTKCVTCPPDKHPSEYYCAWEFEIR